MSFNKKVAKGLKWTLIENILGKGTAFVTTILLTRFLTPNDFGLVGLMAVFITTGNALVQGGLASSLIRDNESNTVDFSTVFYTNFAMSCAIYTILYLCAPYISLFFEEPKLLSLIRVYSIIFIINAFSTIQKTILIKEMAFKKITLIVLPSIIISSITAMFLAYSNFGVWSIIILQLLTQTINALFFWFLSSWKPKLEFSIPKFKFHFKFGYNLMLSTILNSVFNEFYSLLIGKKFSVAVLGFYSRAKTFNQLPNGIISNVISTVTYPLLSTISNDKEQISKIYQSILRSIFFGITPLMLTLCIVSEPLFMFLFGEKWLPAVPYFQILTLSSILTPIHNFNLNVFKVYGRSDLILKLSIVKKGIILLVAFVGMIWGMYPLLWAMVLSSYVGLFVNTYYSGELINYTTGNQIFDMLPILLTGLFSAAMGFYVLNSLDSLHLILQVLIVSIIIPTIYLGLNRLIRNKSYRDFFKNSKIFFNESGLLKK